MKSGAVEGPNGADMRSAPGHEAYGVMHENLVVPEQNRRSDTSRRATTSRVVRKDVVEGQTPLQGDGGSHARSRTAHP